MVVAIPVIPSFNPTRILPIALVVAMALHVAFALPLVAFSVVTFLVTFPLVSVTIVTIMLMPAFMLVAVSLVAPFVVAVRNGGK
jgi:hypothetical protein